MMTEKGKSEKSAENNLTISTKLSTDHLICKTPQESPMSSKRDLQYVAQKGGSDKNCYSVFLYLGVLQMLCGLLMSVFGILVILHDSSLSQIGGGIWGGCLAVAAGTAGILSSAKDFCPLKSGAQKVAQTVFLALSLISLAIAQLVLVFAATGLARDVQKSEIIQIDAEEDATDDIIEVLPSNYPALLSNIGLLVVSALECVCAAVASYRGARAVCPCFKREEDNLHSNLKIGAGDSLVNSWLGKHPQVASGPQQIYVVHSAAPVPSAAPSSIGKHSKLSISPIYTLPQPVYGQTIYPLIPAPLGPVPSPIIPTLPKDRNYRRPRQIPFSQIQLQQQQMRSKSRSRSKSVEKHVVTDEDVAKTYTGLDRTIAEEFIEICDSRNNSLCSDSSNFNTSDIGSRDYLIDKM